MRIAFTLFIASTLSFSIAHAQDAQSLGDVARQARQEKQQKEEQAKDAAALSSAATDPQNATNSADPALAISHHVITNEEIPEHAGSSTVPLPQPRSSHRDELMNPSDKEAQGRQWKGQIQQQKAQIASLQRAIDQIGNSIHYASGGCRANCVKWNQRQEQKQQQVDSMKFQLQETQRRLEEMQETVRKQGFGSSVYDP